MNDQQIRKLVLSMDEDMRLGKDMVEQVSHYCKDVAALKYFCVQLLKYVPMKSEVEVGSSPKKWRAFWNCSFISFSSMSVSLTLMAARIAKSSTAVTNLSSGSPDGAFL